MLNQISDERFHELLASIGLTVADLPVSEPELGRRIHARLGADERDELRAALVERGKLEAAA